MQSFTEVLEHKAIITGVMLVILAIKLAVSDTVPPTTIDKGQKYT